MFSRSFEQRLSAWHDFRENLRNSSDPIQDTIDLYRLAPIVSMNCDPWDPDTWLNPWELLQENLYCEYCILLGICYTLQLADNLTYKNFEIHISIDTQTTDRYYLLCIDDRVVGYDDQQHISINDLPQSLYTETVHHMPSL